MENEYVDLAAGQLLGPGLGVWEAGVCFRVVTGTVDLILGDTRLVSIGPEEFFIEPAARLAGARLVAAVDSRIVVIGRDWPDLTARSGSGSTER